MSEEKIPGSLEGLGVRIYKGQKYITMTDGAVYTGYSYPGFRKKIAKIARDHAADESKPHVRRIDAGKGAIYVCVADLDIAFAPKELSDDDLLD